MTPYAPAPPPSAAQRHPLSPIHALNSWQGLQLPASPAGGWPINLNIPGLGAPQPAAHNTADKLVCDARLYPTGSGQHQWGSSYTNWTSQGAGVHFTQAIKLSQLAPSSFHTQQFALTGADTGYIGLQTHGITDSGSLQLNARFSLWNSVAASGPKCSTFGGEGVGHTCVAQPLNLPLETFHLLRMDRMSTEPDGTWWRGSVVNGANGHTTILGSIKVRHSGQQRAIRSALNFSEYFGSRAADCRSVPQSIVSWRPPVLHDEQGRMIIDRFASFTKATPDKSCTEAGVEASGRVVNSGVLSEYQMTNGSIVICNKP